MSAGNLLGFDFFSAKNYVWVRGTGSFIHIVFWSTEQFEGTGVIITFMITGSLPKHLVGDITTSEHIHFLQQFPSSKSHIQKWLPGLCRNANFNLSRILCEQCMLLTCLDFCKVMFV